jgi:hypothetical protein
MKEQRFGRKINPPSTIAIKHQLLEMMLEDEVRASLDRGLFDEKTSPALAMLRRLNAPRLDRNAPAKGGDNSRSADLSEGG